MQFDLNVDHDGTPYQLVAGPADIAAFEREFDSSIEVLSDDSKRRMTHLYWLAWHAASRTKRTGMTFDEWIDGLTDIVIKDDTAPAPLAVSPLPG